MGNCVFKGFKMEVEEEIIKVVTTNGGIMELNGPITAQCITNEFPGHAIFRSRDDHYSQEPLLHDEELHGGQLYYILPLNTNKKTALLANPQNINNNTSSCSPSKLTPYRMSMDNQRVLKRSTEAEVFPRYNSSGVWKVKLVISSEQLAEILAQDARTEALIESVRTVAKCGNWASSSVANSDQESLCSSWKG